jgi:glycosyltransferase involved in cell wall biosynthesis
VSFEDVSVVMITKDEEGSVAKVIDDLRRDVPGAEVVLVDSSQDRTAEIAEERGARVIRQFPPRGYGPAMVRALHAPDRDIVVTLDCDDTYPTGRIPELVAASRDGVDVAGTTRLAGGRPASMPRSNYLANRLFNVVASLLFLRPVRDLHTGMRAYRRALLHEIHWSAEGSALPVELLLKPVRLGMRVTEVEISYAERIGETTLDRFSSTVWTFRRILRCRFLPRGRLLTPRR